MFICNFLNKNCCPESTKDKIIVKAKGWNFYNGLSNEYETEFPMELDGLVYKNAWKHVITEVNHIVEDYFPCGPAQLIGTCCCPVTLGCSLIVPYMCVRDCESLLNERIAKHNKNYFLDVGYKMVLKKRCLATSWLQIEKLNQNKLDFNNQETQLE